MKNLLLVFVLILSTTTANCQKNYLEESNEDSARRMKWFTDAKYGMFIHFGLYSQLGGVWQGDTIKEYAEWIQAHADITPQEYAMLTHTFNPTEFDADLIVSTAKKAGMKYLVVTTKHHEGFCLWDSKYTDFDIANTPFKRDIIKELADACRKYDIHFGTYYSIIDWHHPSQERNLDNSNAARWSNVRMKTGKKQQYITYMKNQIKELIENYDTEIFVFPAAYYLAAKFEAHKRRGGTDLRQSHDFEDIIYILDNCSELLDNIKASKETVKTYLVAARKLHFTHRVFILFVFVS
ncbi:MAG: alpha-L-fucosidase [Bacteroidales bacterium]